MKLRPNKSEPKILIKIAQKKVSFHNLYNIVVSSLELKSLSQKCLGFATHWIKGRISKTLANIMNTKDIQRREI